MEDELLTRKKRSWVEIIDYCFFFFFFHAVFAISSSNYRNL